MKKIILSILLTSIIFGTFYNFAFAEVNIPVIVTDKNPERDSDILVDED